MATNSVIGALRVNLGIDTAQFNKGLGQTQTRLASFAKAAADERVTIDRDGSPGGGTNRVDVVLHTTPEIAARILRVSGPQSARISVSTVKEFGKSQQRDQLRGG